MSYVDDNVDPTSPPACTLCLRDAGQGYPPINVKFADRRRYYEAFDDYARSGSPQAMTTLIAEYLVDRMQQMIDIIKQANNISDQ